MEGERGGDRERESEREMALPCPHLLDVGHQVEELVLASAGQVGGLQGGHHGKVLVVRTGGAGGAGVSIRGPGRKHTVWSEQDETDGDGVCACMRVCEGVCVTK